MATPNLILMGYGVTDSLQLTVESQRLLVQAGSAYTLGLPQNLAAYLKMQRVKVTDLSDRLPPGRDYAEGYLEIASFLLERTAHERPVILLSPGNPMLFNAIGRYLAMEGRRLGLGVRVVPAVSPLDVILAAIGLDVSTFGLQVFDAARLIARQIQVNPQVPALVMNVGGLGTTSVPGPGAVTTDIEPLEKHLAGFFPPSHTATVVNVDERGTSVASAPLGSLSKVADQLGAGSHLFLDLVRPQHEGTPAS